MDGVTVLGALAALVTALGGFVAGVMAQRTKHTEVQATVALSDAQAESLLERTEHEIEGREQAAISKEWRAIREELKADNARLRAEVERLGEQVSKVVTQLDTEHRARVAAEERLMKVEREMLEAIGSRDYLEQKLKRLEMYVDLLLQVIRQHGIAPPRMDPEQP